MSAIEEGTGGKADKGKDSKGDDEDDDDVVEKKVRSKKHTKGSKVSVSTEKGRLVVCDMFSHG